MHKFCQILFCVNLKFRFTDNLLYRGGFAGDVNLIHSKSGTCQGKHWFTSFSGENMRMTHDAV